MKLGKCAGRPNRFSMEECEVEVIYQSLTQRVTRAVFHGDCSMVFSADRITGQTRIWIDSEVRIVDGNVVLNGGYEAGPPEWN